MDFKQLAYFKVVVEAGSLSQAARQLGLSQPPLSIAISKLERELGVQLLKRTTRGVIPTGAGIYLLSESTRLLTERSRLGRTLSMMGAGEIGHFRLGVECMVINEFVTEVLSEFVSSSPSVSVSLTDTTPEDIVHRIRLGDLDMGCIPFGPDQFAGPVTEFCEFLQVGVISVRLAVPRHRAVEDHPNGFGWGRWIIPQSMPAFYGFPDAVAQALEGKDASYVTLEVSNPQAAVSLVAAGLGVTLVSKRMQATHSDIALLDPPEWVPTMGATLLWRREAELTPLMDRWITLTEVALRDSANDQRPAMHKTL